MEFACSSCVCVGFLPHAKEMLVQTTKCYHILHAGPMPELLGRVGEKPSDLPRKQLPRKFYEKGSQVYQTWLQSPAT